MKHVEDDIAANVALGFTSGRHWRAWWPWGHRTTWQDEGDENYCHRCGGFYPAWQFRTKRK